MLLNYQECIERYGSDYKMSKAIESGQLFKLEAGIYSDREHVDDIEIVCKKYPNAVFTLNSAFYYQGLTDTVPSYYYLATDKNATKIKASSIKQIFDNNDTVLLGVELKEYEGILIKIYSKERLLVDLIRYKNRFSFDYYKEIINCYRRIMYELDFQLIEEYAMCLPKTKKVMDTIQMEVF